MIVLLIVIVQWLLLMAACSRALERNERALRRWAADTPGGKLRLSAPCREEIILRTG